jgi:hypothetical protein
MGSAGAGLDDATLQADLAAGLGSERGFEMGRWLFMALLAVAPGALAGCAATGPLSGDPCWGFFACTGWH